jgi:hypothetical protein
MKSCSGLLDTNEVYASYSLLFGQSVGGKDEARRLFGVPVCVVDYADDMIQPDLAMPLKFLNILKWTGTSSVCSLKIL